MTGRELIQHILESHLENKDIIPFGRSIDSRDYTSLEDVAVSEGVGVETVKAWVELLDMPVILYKNKQYLSNICTTVIRIRRRKGNLK